MRLSMLTGFLWLASLVVGVSATAAPLQLDDFAYGVRLVTPPKAGLVKILLPESIYRDLAHADGADLRVFAMDGQVIPHYIPPRGANDPRPRELFFAIRSSQALVLAYGSRRVPAAAPPPELMRRVAQAGKGAPTVRVGPRIELGGAARLEGAANPASGRMISLSSLLLGCVLLLAFLAWWLARRMLR